MAGKLRLLLWGLSLHDGPCALSARTQGLGIHVTSVGARSSLQRCVTAGKTEVIWMLDWLRRWAVIRRHEEGLLRNADGVEEGASKGIRPSSLPATCGKRGMEVLIECK